MNEQLSRRIRNLEEVDTTIANALGFDQEDFAASAAAMYLFHGDDIVNARQFASSRVVEQRYSYTPDPTVLRDATLDFVTSAAHQSTKLLPSHAESVEYFWHQIGTAIFGAEIEIFSEGTKVDSLPITSDGVFHNARRDHDEFVGHFKQKMKELRVGEAVRLETEPSLEPLHKHYLDRQIVS